MRTVLVGDVHGCLDELSRLLEAVALCPGDRLVFVGDLVARGPDSHGVVKLARKRAATSVLGNHEQRVLAAWRARQAGEAGPKLGAAHARVLDELTDSDWSYLQNFPLYLDLPEHDLRIVHAGLVPGVAMEAQDPWLLTHLRSIGSDGQPTDKIRPISWAQRYQGPPHVVFGHNALVGLQLWPCATGLDTACVYGGELSALVLDAGEPVATDVERRRKQIVQVKAKRAYFDVGPGKLG